jgi:hypothetical protein
VEDDPEVPQKLQEWRMMNKLHEKWTKSMDCKTMTSTYGLRSCTAMTIYTCIWNASIQGRCRTLQWWVDASFAIHRDMKSHTGLTMSMGKGSIISSSTWQKINMKSSMEAELVGVDDSMSIITWVCNFMEEQGFGVKDNVVYRDNQCAILLEWNGQASSGCCSRHINIHYFL